MRATRILAAVAALAMVAGARGEEPAPFDPEGYRSVRYRSPVKADPAPAARIDLPAALALTPGEGALFIDVMPAEGGLRDPATGTWRLAQEHLTIPGAEWHPETGRAPVDAVLWQALEDSIREARRTAPGKPVILFCRIDCWMSWNAARRLARHGIGNVHWFAEGTDGWHAAGRRLEVAMPIVVRATR